MTTFTMKCHQVFTFLKVVLVYNNLSHFHWITINFIMGNKISVFDLILKSAFYRSVFVCACVCFRVIREVRTHVREHKVGRGSWWAWSHGAKTVGRGTSQESTRPWLITSPGSNTPYSFTTTFCKTLEFDYQLTQPRCHSRIECSV
jgi:hypothetical protein